MNVTIIGFGEAGPVFAKQLIKAGKSVIAWDKLQSNPDTAQQQIDKTKSVGASPAESMQQAVQSADLIISTVTASQALVAAKQAVNYLRPGCHWLDLNSVSPGTKHAIYKIVSAKSVVFTEAVAMDTIPVKGIKVPIILCGTESEKMGKVLNEAGLNTRSVSSELGAASTTKLLRSILIKGMEALFVESMEAAGAVNLQDEVIASLQATYPGLNWQEVAGYQLSRATIHAQRRAAEMREASEMVKQLGVEPIMTRAIADRQQDLSDRSVAANYNSNTTPSIANFIDAVHQTKKA